MFSVNVSMCVKSLFATAADCRDWMQWPCVVRGQRRKVGGVFWALEHPLPKSNVKNYHVIIRDYTTTYSTGTFRNNHICLNFFISFNRKIWRHLEPSDTFMGSKYTKNAFAGGARHNVWSLKITFCPVGSHQRSDLL